MEQNFNENERYRKASEKVKELKEFYTHVISYLVINITLLVINLVTSPMYLWSFWSIGCWGIGLVFHGLKTFDYFPFFSKEWEQRKINEFMEKEKNTKWK